MIARRRTCLASLSGFTLLEALLSIVIAAMAALALMLGLTSSMQTTEHGTEQMIAVGVAEQLADEIVGRLYVGTGQNPYGTTFGTEGAEAGAARANFDDADDFDLFSSKPPASPLEVVLGEDDGQGGLRHPNFQMTPPHFADWRTAVEVYYVSDSDPSVRLAPGITSSLRAIEVRVLREVSSGVEREIAKVRRVIGYIPSP